NKVFLLLFPLTKNDASLMRWASPPESVLDDCPNLTYPKPTSAKGCNLLIIFCCPAKKVKASSTVNSSTSYTFFSFQVTSSTCCLKRLPPHASQVRNKSAMNCISIFTSPSPWQTSHLPPSTLKENAAGLSPAALAAD